MKRKKIKLDELSYMSFEAVFSKYCSGDIQTDSEIDGLVKPTQQNIDTHILLPAAMTEKEEQELIGYGNISIDKTLLTRYRTGERKISEDIKNTFKKKNAVELVQSRFSKILPDVVYSEDKMDLLYEISDIIQQDYSIPKIHMERFQREITNAELELHKEIAYTNLLSESTNTECFYLFLADAFVFSVLRDEIVRKTPRLSRKVARVLKELDITNNTNELETIIGEMCSTIMDEKHFHPGVISVKSINDTEFTDDDFRQIVLTSLPIRHLLDPVTVRLLYLVQTFIAMLDINGAALSLSKEGKYGIAKKYGLPRSSIQLHDVEVGTEHIELITNIGGHKLYTEFDFNEDGSVKNSRKVFPYEDL